MLHLLKSEYIIKADSRLDFSKLAVDKADCTRLVRHKFDLEKLQPMQDTPFRRAPERSRLDKSVPSSEFKDQIFQSPFIEFINSLILQKGRNKRLNVRGHV